MQEAEAALASEQDLSAHQREALGELEAKLAELREALQREVERAFAAEQAERGQSERVAQLGREAELQRERAERAEAREAALQARLRATDYFKLDVIARELKKVRPMSAAACWDVQLGWVGSVRCNSRRESTRDPF